MFGDYKDHNLKRGLDNIFTPENSNVRNNMGVDFMGMTKLNTAP